MDRHISTPSMQTSSPIWGCDLRDLSHMRWAVVILCMLVGLLLASFNVLTLAQREVEEAHVTCMHIVNVVGWRRGGWAILINEMQH